MTKREELFKLHQSLTAQALELMRKKNQDYSREEDPLKNFRKRGLLGMMVRLEDKMARLDTFIETGILAVDTEPVDDLFIDIINYAILMQYWVNEERAAKTDLETQVEGAFKKIRAPIQDSECGCAGWYVSGTYKHDDNCKAWPFPADYNK